MFYTVAEVSGITKLSNDIDLQHKKLNNRLSQEQDLYKNTQILFKQQQPQQDIKALEAHFEDLDTKLKEVKENMALRKQDKPKGFFNKIFNK